MVALCYVNPNKNLESDMASNLGLSEELRYALQTNSIEASVDCEFGWVLSVRSKNLALARDVIKKEAQKRNCKVTDGGLKSSARIESATKTLQRDTILMPD